MAGEWVKMRSSLLTNAKVIKMARTLLADPEFLSWYGNDGVTVTASHCVTRRHVTVVTRVTVGGLLAVWASVNECAARDGLLRGVTLFEVDEMAGVPGFGRAMEVVEWLHQLPENKGIEFVNFTEHNTVGQERSTTAKTAAERAREYRERKALKDAENVTNGVTEKRDASRDTVTTEKSREEKNSSSLRSEESAGKPASLKPKREDKTLKTYLDDCRQAGQKPVPADHAIRAYCRDAGISDEMLQVAWCVFRDEYTAGTNKAKRYKDWPGHFANAVKGCWAKLWWTDGTTVAWTSRGQQEKAVLDARARARETAHEPA